MTFGARLLQNNSASKFRVVNQLVAATWALVDAAFQQDAARFSVSEFSESLESTTYQGSLHPPSGQWSSKTSGDDRRAVRLGCFSHFTGKPSYKWSFCFKWSKKVLHTALPFRAWIKVSEFPIKSRPFRARDTRTFNLSGDFMKPISREVLLRVSEAITISLSSPW